MADRPKLSEIREWAQWTVNGSAPELLAAVDAVLALHSSDGDKQAPLCLADDQPYPCETRCTITDHLDVEG